MKPTLRPDWYCAHVADIAPGWLVAESVRAVLLDLDNTLQARDEGHVDARARAWLGALADAGMRCCIVSNTAKPRVRAAAESLGLPVVENAYKPFAGGYVRACELLGVERAQAVMVGDQTYTDILGAHHAGMRAILVEPLCDLDPRHTRMLRALDAWVVRAMSPEVLDARSHDRDSGGA